MESCCRCIALRSGSRIKTMFTKQSCLSIFGGIIRNNSTTTSNSSYCINMVRKYDYEHYLCTLLLPEIARRAAFAVRAFNVEIAQVRDVVSDVNIGRMRLEFWRESVKNIYKGVAPKAPVAMEISKVFGGASDTEHLFLQMIEARERIMADRSMLSLAELEQYADDTAVAPLLLLLHHTGDLDVTTEHLASHLGKSQGYVTLIRGIPFNAQSRRVYIPSELLVMHKVSQEDIMRGSREQKVKDMIYEAASQAHIHLNQARDLQKDIPRAALPVFFPAVCARVYLDQLQKADFDVFDPVLQKRHTWLPLKLLLAKLKRQI